MRRIAIVTALIGLLLPLYEATVAEGCQRPGALWGAALGYDEPDPNDEVTLGEVCEEWDRLGMASSLLMATGSVLAAAFVWHLASQYDDR